MEKLLTRITPFLTSTGRDGVGKTSLSCATTVALAGQGSETLLVNTDFASNLNQILGVTLESPQTMR